MIRDFQGQEILVLTDTDSENVYVLAARFNKMKTFCQYSWQGIPSADEFEETIKELLHNEVSREDIEEEIQLFRESEFYKELYKWHNDPTFVG